MFDKFNASFLNNRMFKIYLLKKQENLTESEPLNSSVYLTVVELSN